MRETGKERGAERERERKGGGERFITCIHILSRKKNSCLVSESNRDLKRRVVET